MNPSRQRKTLALSALVIALVTVVYWQTLPSPFTVPIPNGYDDFLHAALVTPGVIPDYSNRQVLEELVSRNTEAYAAIRAGLEKACGVPIQLTSDYHATHAQELPKLKHLAHCLIARGELARMQWRTAEAVESYAEAYRFAHNLGRGGLPLDYLVHAACKLLVLKHVECLVPELTSDQRTELLAVIEHAESDAESPAAVDARMRRWEFTVLGLRAWLQRSVSKLAESVKTLSLDPFRSERKLLAEAQRTY